MMDSNSPFQVGDRVQVSEQETIFRDDIGTVTEINTHESRLTIEIDLFDRPTPLELDFDQARQFLARIEGSL